MFVKENLLYTITRTNSVTGYITGTVAKQLIIYLVVAAFWLITYFWYLFVFWFWFAVYTYNIGGNLYYFLQKSLKGESSIVVVLVNRLQKIGLELNCIYLIRLTLALGDLVIQFRSCLVWNNGADPRIRAGVSTG